jgi:chromate reductase
LVFSRHEFIRMPANVVMISGSLRKRSFNSALMRSLQELAPGLAMVEAPSYASFPLYDADLQASSGFPEDVKILADAIRAADGVVIVTPEYNWTIPGPLKNAIDWVSRLERQPFKQKPVAIQSATVGPLGGARMQYHLRMALIYLDALVVGTPEVFVGNVHTKINPDTLELTDESTRAVLAQQMAAFEGLINRTRS